MRVWHLAIWWEPGTGLWPTHAWRFLKCLEPCRHSPKKGHLRHQAIKLAPRVWGDSPLKLKEHRCVYVWHECRLTGIQVKQRQPTITGTKTHSTWSVKIRRIIWFNWARGPQLENERKRKDGLVLRSCYIAEKTMEHVGDDDAHDCWCTGIM